MGLSRNKIRYIRSLKLKKNRDEQQVFIAEGDKLVSELLNSCRCQFLTALPEWVASHPKIYTQSAEVAIASSAELSKATFLKTAPPVIAVFHRPQYNIEQFDANSEISIVLDGVQDPGNVGTIFRIADWFGIEWIIASNDSADLYNPKTVQATMGAIARVRVINMNIMKFLSQNINLPIYGAFLDGNNIYEEELSDSGIIVMGGEGSGIRPEVEKIINSRLFIPSYPPGRATSESLNVATATAIICSEFRRRKS